jgi:DNA-binding transcriptional LysR family regulator
MQIPSLQTLRAFDAAGRHRSYSGAGEELGLTHSAVSHRIRGLEALTGHRLFERQGNRMVPTAEGQRLLGRVRNALGLLEDIFGEHRPVLARALTVSVFPALASRWLVPRLGDFRERYPEFELKLDLSSQLVELGNGIDAALRFGEGSWPGTECRLLAREIVLPVCTPAYLAAHPIGKPADLLGCTLLRHPWHSWAAWFEAAGTSAGEARQGPEYGDSSLLIDAALAGEGVALARGLSAFDLLRSGTLACPWPAFMPARYSYYFVRPEGSNSAALDLLEAWVAAGLIGDAAELNRMLERLAPGPLAS